jgi:hypothetical protein
MVMQYRRAQDSAMIRRGHVKHGGFAFSGDEKGS